MPLKGYTTDAEPGRLFKPDELLDYLASPLNASGFTHSMAEAAITGYRGDDAISATTLTSTCPREFKLKQESDYTLRLEASFFSLFGTYFHSMLEHASIPVGWEGLTIRERRYAKKFVLESGRVVMLPARMDELLLDYTGPGEDHMRDFKTTKAVPKGNTPYPTHAGQMDYYRMVLSDFPEPPYILPANIEFWEPGAQEQWKPTDPVNVVTAELVYIDRENAKRVFMGRGTAREFKPVQQVYDQARERLEVLLAEDMVSFEKAVSSVASGGYGFAWKCEYCPVATACHQKSVADKDAAPNPTPQRTPAPF